MENIFSNKPMIIVQKKNAAKLNLQYPLGLSQIQHKIKSKTNQPNGLAMSN